MKNICAVFICLLFPALPSFGQEDTALAKATAQKLIAKWGQTHQSAIRQEPKAASSLLTLNKDSTYSWVGSTAKKERGTWNTDNYSKMSNTGKMTELLILQRKGGKRNSIFIQHLSDSTLVLRTYDYRNGSPAKDTYTDLHFKKQAR